MEPILLELFEFRDNVQLFHFQTSHYGAHVAADTLVTAVNTLMDQLLEVLQGSARQRVQPLDTTLHLRSHSLSNMVKYATAFAARMDQYSEHAADESLSNIFAELQSAAQRFVYLLSFQ